MRVRLPPWAQKYFIDMESLPEQSSEIIEKEKSFEELFESTLQNKRETVPVIEYNLPYPKEDFLVFLVGYKNVVLHGSGQNLDLVSPKQANDSSKQSGNKEAVYSVDDPVLPIFYAIQDRSKLHGMIESGHYTEENDETGEIKSEYVFKIPKKYQGTSPWKQGFVYIFNKNEFHPEEDDHGNLSGEWTSRKPVKPIAKLLVSSEDFRYLDKIQYY